MLIFLVGCVKNFDNLSIDNGEKILKLNVEIADDNEERMNGLMFRKNLDENSGMFFVFENEKLQTFWMKNTLIPLDIIFIDKDLKIVDIKHAVPCEKDPCVLYKSSEKSRFVLEVNGNFTIKNNINIGNRIIINKNY